MELLSALEKILRKGNHPSSCHGMQIAFFFAQKVTEKKFSAPFAASIQMSLLFRSCLPHVPRKRKFVFLQQVGKRDLNHCELKDDTNSACEDKQVCSTTNILIISIFLVGP
uniref:Uncharacterized protein n=1 Tax=Physcomitrium patens TaxID=3218 RepID=A0A7I4EBK8_PHYPA